MMENISKKITCSSLKILGLEGFNFGYYQHLEIWQYSQAYHIVQNEAEKIGNLKFRICYCREAL